MPCGGFIDTLYLECDVVLTSAAPNLDILKGGAALALNVRSCHVNTHHVALT